MEFANIKIEDINLFFKAFDTNRDGTLKFSEFSNAFSSVDNALSKYLFDRKPVDL